MKITSFFLAELVFKLPKKLFLITYYINQFKTYISQLDNQEKSLKYFKDMQRHLQTKMDKKTIDIIANVIDYHFDNLVYSFPEKLSISSRPKKLYWSKNQLSGR